MAAKRRAIGIIRVSEVKGREPDSFHTADVQRERIEAECKRQGLRLVGDPGEELDVSGGKPLAERPKLLAAIEAIEGNKAEVVMVAYFDRLVRSLTTQSEVVKRVETAGGQVLAVDSGAISEGTAAQWLNGTVQGMMADYMRRSVKERSGDAQRNAVRNGKVPWPNIPPGYRKGDDGKLVPEPHEASVVAQAFSLRADGATVKEVRAYLTAHGIVRTWHGVQAMLKSRVYLGEVHFGNLHNLEAHEAIVSADVWVKAQRTEIRGPKPKSDRLLARLDVLRCGTCGGRMSVGTQTQHGRKYGFYRCSPLGDCPNRMAVSADIAETVVSHHVRTALTDVKGRASAEANVRNVMQERDDAAMRLDRAVRAFDGIGDVTSVREQLAKIRGELDDAQARVDRLGDVPQADALVIDGAKDWDRLSVDGRRALIRRFVEQATVAPGRGADRIAVKLFAE